MGALDTRLAEAAAELRHQRSVLDKLEKDQQIDHDLLTKQGEWVRTLFNRVEAIERERSEEAKESKKDYKEGDKEKSSRSWQVWLAIIGAFVAAVLGTLAGKLL